MEESPCCPGSLPVQKTAALPLTAEVRATQGRLAVGSPRSVEPREQPPYAQTLQKRESQQHCLSDQKSPANRLSATPGRVRTCGDVADPWLGMIFEGCHELGGGGGKRSDGQQVAGNCVWGRARFLPQCVPMDELCEIQIEPLCPGHGMSISRSRVRPGAWSLRGREARPPSSRNLEGRAVHCPIKFPRACKYGGRQARPQERLVLTYKHSDMGR